ncbi:hypothetical protein AB0D04_14330 [Streptomyces sp. NPDC048483]|uniref:hypothetical protein n=1 Tax=Streptomyces sp. NPDC048483 TaxID=3154927 RepID=UPI003437C349
MPERSVEVQGVEALCHECRAVVQDESAPAVPGLPVIVALGPRGSGKSTLLQRLGRQAANRPHALYNFGSTSGPRRPHEVAGRLAYGLSQRIRHQPALLFPRLTLGLFAVAPELSLDTTDRRRARQQLRQALRGPATQPSPAADHLTGVAEALKDLNLVAIPGISLLAGLIRQPPRLPAAVTRHTEFAWYADRRRSALEALIDLNLDAKDEAQQAAVDRLLCQAFLADLRGEYARRERDRNCLVLLDNIDAEGGREFLDLLGHLRQESGASDPLLVVATASDAPEVRVRPAQRASRADWVRHAPASPHAPRRSWYHVRLRDLTAAETQKLGADLAVFAPQAPLLIQSLTQGHQWSVRHLLDAAAGLPDHDGDSTARLRGMVTGPGEPDRTVLDHLLAGLTDAEKEPLITAAAAREPETVVDAGLIDADAYDTLMGGFGIRLWLTDPAPQDAAARGGQVPDHPDGRRPPPPASRPALHPWLRLLLLQELARRPGRWSQVHGDLKTWHRANARDERRIDELYHTLALGELDAVVAHLARRLAQLGDTDAWLYELYAITAAPLHRPVEPERSAALRTDALAQELAPESFGAHRALTMLVAALWLASDPRNRLPAARPELHSTIGSMFRELAMKATPARVDLRHEAEKYVAHSATRPYR